jgi:CO/xanthine dehydrogenase FAD-binding subunit
MFDFEAIVAENLDHCLRILGECGRDAALVAGGTDLYILMKTGMKHPRVVVHIGKDPELRILGEEDSRIRIGATVTHTELAGNASTRDIVCLSEAARSIGSRQIRNLATAGGNIANASPAGDLYPPLLVLNALVEIRGAGGRRDVRLEDFATGPGMTMLQPGEVITGVTFEKPTGKFFSGFAKIGLRNALAISVASAALIATAKDGELNDVRIGCGAVAPRAIRMKEVEALVAGERPTPELIRQAAEVASRECDPLTDIRATCDYRRHVTGVIVSRLLEDACRHLLGYGEGDDPDA